MGSRIKKVIGYGMPIGQFKFHVKSRLEDDDDLHEYIEDRIKTISDLVKTPRQDIIDNLKGTGSRLASTITWFPNEPDRWLSPSDMFDLVWEGDTRKYIVFQPMLDDLKWKRNDDDIDYVEDSILHGHDGFTIIHQREYGFYPWGNFIRDAKTNEPIDWEGPLHMIDTDGKRPSSIVPDVPPCMRYWLLATEVLDKDGVDALRPVYAKWWS